MKKFSLIILCITILLSGFLSSCSNKNLCFGEVIFVITDQLNTPIKDAEICFKKFDQTYFTDKDGKTQNIKIALPQNDTETWYGTTITIKKQGFVPLVVFNFVLNYDKERNAKIMLLFDDGTLPYCAYVEVPSDKEIRQILLS